MTDCRVARRCQVATSALSAGTHRWAPESKIPSVEHEIIAPGLLSRFRPWLSRSIVTGIFDGGQCGNTGCPWDRNRSPAMSRGGMESRRELYSSLPDEWVFALCRASKPRRAMQLIDDDTPALLTMIEP